VLFSEPKIPQSRSARRRRCSQTPVSVLFSEPKIPQLLSVVARQQHHALFQCSSASRKFLNNRAKRDPATRAAFQCSSASRKFLNVP